MDQQHLNSSAGGNVHLNQSHSPHGQTGDDDLSPTNLGLGITNNSNTADFFSSSTQYLPSQSMPMYDTSNSGQSSQFTQASLADNLYAPVQTQPFQPTFEQQLNGNDGQNNPHFFTNDLLNTTDFNQADFTFPDTSNVNGMMNMTMNANMNSNMNLNTNVNGNTNQQYDPLMFVHDIPIHQSDQSINPQDLGVLSQHSHSSSQQQMFGGNMSQPSSAQHSPAVAQGPFGHTPGHSRNHSLQPEAANYPNAQINYGQLGQAFQHHRRTPSEYSDISASSAAPSPHLVQHDSFDDHGTSPLMQAQDQTVIQDLHAIGQFSLSEPQLHHGASPLHGRSPAHSPSPSPRLTPQGQIPLPEVNQHSPFSLNMSIPPNMSHPHPFTHHHSEPNVNIYNNESMLNQRSNSEDTAPAVQMPPPDINIVLAPSRQNSFEPPKPSNLDQDALTPPQRGRRPRASSDVTFSSGGYSRPSTPGLSPRGLGSSVRGGSPNSVRSLSPHVAASSGHRRRHSTSAAPSPSAQRDYVLNLADPEHQSTTDNGKPRVQKHPATFQCTLCPKRFTRAYNLRSHLRTHTDERPFVCTVCGKAFARQHDRKRHEGLHSGEKKFVCKGELKQGGTWGCNRRFARADALGRHFRSEAGRICIKPLLDEEQMDRQRQWAEQNFPQQGMQMSMDQQMQQQQHQQPGFVDLQGQYALPARLIAQYPALANLTWSDVPQGEGVFDEDLSGRSSFDASGSEYYDEVDEGGYVSGPGTGFGTGQVGAQGFNQGYVSDYGGR